MADCRGCGASIVWAATSAGGMMPVDPMPAPERDGNVRLFTDDDGVHCEVLGPLDIVAMPDEGASLHRSHFATCPQAARFRR